MIVQDKDGKVLIGTLSTYFIQIGCIYVLHALFPTLSTMEGDGKITKIICREESAHLKIREATRIG